MGLKRDDLGFVRSSGYGRIRRAELEQLLGLGAKEAIYRSGVDNGVRTGCGESDVRHRISGYPRRCAFTIARIPPSLESMRTALAFNSSQLEFPTPVGTRRHAAVATNFPSRLAPADDLALG